MFDLLSPLPCAFCGIEISDDEFGVIAGERMGYIACADREACDERAAPLIAEHAALLDRLQNRPRGSYRYKELRWRQSDIPRSMMPFDLWLTQQNEDGWQPVSIHWHSATDRSVIFKARI